MSKELLNATKIGELIKTLRELFKYHQDLQDRREVAISIQRPKIPPLLSRSLVVDLGNRGGMRSLECSDFDLLPGKKNNVVAISSNRQVKIIVKATGKSAFQNLGNKDIDADFLVWVHFNRYFEDDWLHEIEILTLREPKRIFPQSRKITLAAFKKEGGESIVSINVNLDQYMSMSTIRRDEDRFLL